MELVWVIITLLLLHFRHNSLPLCGLHKTESAEVPLRNLGGKIFIREGLSDCDTCTHHIVIKDRIFMIFHQYRFYQQAYFLHVMP